MTAIYPPGAPPREEEICGLDGAFVSFVDRLEVELEAIQSFVDAHAPGDQSGGPLGPLYERFSPWLDARIVHLRSLAERLGPGAAAAHGAYFRRRMRRFTEQSEFLKRTNDRPRGYAGDSAMMSMLYDPDFRGASTFGRLLHRHPVDSAAARAVRARVDFVAAQVRGRGAGRPLRILSLACGPARELRELVPGPGEAARLDLVLLDQDEGALREAGDEIAAIERRLGVSLRARLERVGVRELLGSNERARERFGTFDVVYAMGLFDYLEGPVAKRLVERLAALTNDGGALAVGNFHVSTETRAYLDYWMNWPLIYRTEDDMLRLAADVPGARARVAFEPTGSQMFLLVERDAPAEGAPSWPSD